LLDSARDSLLEATDNNKLTSVMENRYNNIFKHISRFHEPETELLAFNIATDPSKNSA